MAKNLLSKTNSALRLIPIALAAFVTLASRSFAEDFRWKDGGPGIASTAVSEPGPVFFAVVRIEYTRPDIEITTTKAGNVILSLDTISSQLSTIPRELGSPIAAINGDFYKTENESFSGDPRGLQILRGELISAPTGQAAFWSDEQGKLHGEPVAPHLTVIWPDGHTNLVGLNEEKLPNSAVLYTPRLGGTSFGGSGTDFILESATTNYGAWLPLRAGSTYQARVKEIRKTSITRVARDTMVLSVGPFLARNLSAVTNGTSVQIEASTTPELKGVQAAIGGGPMLVSGGKPIRVHINKGDERHPRSAAGWDEKFLYLVVADGRQQSHSVGVPLYDMSTFLVRLGCKEGINLDGGGSAEVIVNGRIVNRPCYGRERDTANALVVLRKPATPPSEKKSQPATGQ